MSLDDASQRKQYIAGIFHRASQLYDHTGPRFFSHLGRRLVEIAEIPAGAQVLDVACGRGAVLFPAAKAVMPQGRIVGVDIAEGMVQETSTELAALGLSSNAEVRLMDAENLQFPSDSFDYVLCGLAIFFFPQLEQAMAELRRVLKPGGRVCVSTWDKVFNDQWDWFGEVVGAHLPPTPETSRTEPSPWVFDTPAGMMEIMNNAGFEQVQVFREEAEFVYTPEECWSVFWSHGMRRTMEKLEQVNGAAGLEKFKADIFRKMAEISQEDGIHLLYPTLITVASKPGQAKEN